MNKRYLLRYLLISIALLFNACEAASPDTSAISQFTSSAVNANASVETAYAKKLSDVQVSGHGVVTKLLPDDQKGARHQKFLVRINTEQTLLFAHNIDLAERLPVKMGDAVSFNGEYV